MDDSTFEEEIGKRLKRLIKANRIRFSWALIFLIVGHILLYVFYMGVGGKDYANQNFSQLLPSLLLVDFVLFIGSYVYIAYYKIPAEVYYEQRRIISERLPEQLSLSIERTPNIVFTKDGKRGKVAALLITNLEKKKIIELRALINFEHFYYVLDKGYVGETGYQLNAPLYWGGEEPPKKEIELRPETGKVVIICELLKAKMNDGTNTSIALMGSDPVPTSSRFAEESIYHIKIMFQGKLEGEYNFRTFHYEDIVYTKPEDQRILFLDDAEKSYPDIPNKLLERSNTVIKYMGMRNKNEKPPLRT